jgi:hypothetical protein
MKNEEITEITVTHQTPGYAHTRIEGRCPLGTTVQQIRDKFYHSYFGGRAASVNGTYFSVIRHDD